VPDGVELVADPQLARGDAVAELADGYLDARLSTALARVRRVLEESG
jgi:flagellar assembly protein FliH